MQRYDLIFNPIYNFTIKSQELTYFSYINPCYIKKTVNFAISDDSLKINRN